MRAFHMDPSPEPPRRLLLTGAAGLIGSRLAHELLQGGWQVVGVDDFSGGWPERLPDGPAWRFIELDVTRPGALGAAMAAEQKTRGPFEAIVHLAARVGVRSVLRDPEGCREANLAGVRGLIEAVSQMQRTLRPRIYNASTSEVYREVRRPLGEADATRVTSGVGRWAYAGSKLRAEQLLDEACARGTGLERPVHLRFFNVVGPGQDADSGMVLANFVEQALAGKALTVHGDGSQVRTFAHVDEVARTLAQIITLGDCPGGALNLGGIARTSIAQLARLVWAESGQASAIVSANPLLDCGTNFEPIAYREPNLDRLRALGVEVPQMELDALVADTLLRHLQNSRPSTRPARPSLCVSPGF